MTIPLVRLDPYRPLFLVGLGHALAGTLLWVLAAFQMIAYPGILHRTLMIEGFEQSFIAGFLLTALGGLTHGGRSSSLEMILATTAQVGVGVAALTGRATLAHGCYFGSVLVLIAAAATRARRGRRHGNPPRELIFIFTALLLGLVGGAVLAAGGRLWHGAPVSLGFRLASLGEVLTLVVGVGSILVPTFLGHRVLTGIANVSKPGWQGTPGFYGIIVLLIVGSFALEASGFVRLGGAARAVGVSAMLLAVWRIHRGGPPSRMALVLRSAGFTIMAGLWSVVLVPSRPLLGEHIVFVGGYGLLTMGIATRVVVSHGGWPRGDEARLLHPLTLVTLTASLAFRIAAELAPVHASGLWGASGALWSVAWLLWGFGAVPRMIRRGSAVVPKAADAASAPAGRST